MVVCSRRIAAFGERWRRHFGEPIGFWAKEFQQAEGQAHLHLLMKGPEYLLMKGPESMSAEGPERALPARQLLDQSRVRLALSARTNGEKCRCGPAGWDGCCWPALRLRTG